MTSAVVLSSTSAVFLMSASTSVVLPVSTAFVSAASVDFELLASAAATPEGSAAFPQPVAAIRTEAASPIAISCFVNFLFPPYA